MTNGEYLIQSHIPFNAISAEKAKGGMIWNIYNSFGGNKIGTIEADENNMDVTGQSKESAWKAIVRWLDAEHKEPILTEKEHDYLAAVIKPWRNEVYSIEKTSYCGMAYLIFSLNDGRSATLPKFTIDTMYRGMKYDTDYSLTDLDL